MVLKTLEKIKHYCDLEIKKLKDVKKKIMVYKFKVDDNLYNKLLKML
jgi:hypothetical protein